MTVQRCNSAMESRKICSTVKYTRPKTQKIARGCPRTYEITVMQEGKGSKTQESQNHPKNSHIASFLGGHGLDEYSGRHPALDAESRADSRLISAKSANLG